jgi:hypothetical protein
MVHNAHPTFRKLLFSNNVLVCCMFAQVAMKTLHVCLAAGEVVAIRVTKTIF